MTIFEINFKIYKYSGCKENEMWGTFYVRPAVGLRQI